MAFCRYCGKKLENDEACNCHESTQTAQENMTKTSDGGSFSQKVAAFAEAAKQSNTAQQGKQIIGNIFNQIMELLKAPATGGESFIRKENVVNSGILIALQGVCSAIFVAIIIAQINKIIGLGGRFTQIWKLSGIGGFFQTWIYSVILSLVFACIYFSVTKLMKGNLNFKQALGVAAMRSVILLPVILVSCILLFINVIVGIACFYIVGTMASISFFAVSSDRISSLSDNKKVYLMFIVMVVFILASVLFAKMVSLNYLPPAMKGMFSWQEIISVFGF